MNIKCFVLALLSFSALAQPFQIINRQVGGNPQTNALLDRLERDINADLPDVDGDRYAEGTANATNQSMKGIGSDYANDIDLFMVSVNVGASADTESSDSFDFDENEVNGFGITQTFAIGTNLGLFRKKNIGFIDPKKLDIYLNFGSTSEGSSDRTDGYDAKIKNIGFHMKYHFLEGQSLLSTYLLKWGGLYLSTGFESASSKLSLFQNFSETETQSGATADFTGVARVNADSQVYSIPIEISSYVQAFYFLSIYGGIGVDINFGGTDIVANIDGDVVLSGSATGTADAILNLSGTGDVDPITARAFLGVQVNISALKIYAQAGKQFGNDIISGSAGVKIAW